MKLNITVDLQDIFDCQNEQAYHDGAQGNSGDGYDLNESIKNEVIGAILNKVSNDCISAVMKKANEKVDDALSSAIEKSIEMIEQKSIDYATDWLNNKNVKITDRWGNVTKETSIQDIVTESFNNTLEKKVDKNGRFSDGYGSSTTLLKYITSEHIEKCVQERLPDMDYRLNEVIRNVLEKQTTDLLAKKLNKVIDDADK